MQSEVSKKQNFVFNVSDDVKLLLTELRGDRINPEFAKSVRLVCGQQTGSDTFGPAEGFATSEQAAESVNMLLRKLRAHPKIDSVTAIDEISRNKGLIEKALISEGQRLGVEGIEAEDNLLRTAKRPRGGAGQSK